MAMNGLDQLKGGVMLLVLVSLVAAAASIAVDSFQDDIGESQCAKRTDTYTNYNSSNKVCYNATNSIIAVGTVDWNTTQEGLQGTANATSYLSTIGTLLGVSALIAVVLSAFYFVSRR